jgi:hypothetical protein
LAGDFSVFSPEMIVTDEFYLRAELLPSIPPIEEGKTCVSAVLACALPLHCSSYEFR